MAGPAYRFLNYTLDLERGCLRDGAAGVRLRRKSFDILSYFVLNAGRLIAKDELMAAAWPNQIVSDDSLVQCVRELRVALADEAHDRIKTVPGRGYIFDLPVTTIAPEPIEPTAKNATVSAGKAAIPWRRALSPRLAISATGLAMALAAGLVWWGDTLHSSTSAPVMPRASVPVRPASIVVLPFVNLSGEPGHDHLADALAEDITTELARLRDTFVISHRSALAYKDRAVDPSTIGRELGVRYVVQGSVRGSGDALRVNVQLVDAESGAQLWAMPLDYARNNVPSTRHPAVTSIALKLGLNVIEAESQRSVRERPDDPDASDLVIRGRALLHRGATRATNEEARALFEAALVRDADSLSALLGVAETNLYSVLNQWAPSDERASRLDRADETVLRAIALAPDHPSARSIRGTLLRARGESEQAIAAFEEAIRLAPNHAQAHAELGRTKMDMGLAAEAVAHIAQATLLSPRDRSLFIWCFWAGQAAVYVGDNEAAVAWLRRAIELRPNYRNSVPWLAVALERLGREEEARRVFDEFRRERPDITVSRWDGAYQRRHPVVLAQREPIYESLRRLGLPE